MKFGMFLKQLASFRVWLAIVFAVVIMLGLPSKSQANEIMRDRCSADVIFVPKYEDAPYIDTDGTATGRKWAFPVGSILLTRTNNNSLEWSEPFTVQTDGSGRIRWWCSSSTGNWLDPGTWRIDGGQIGAKCGDSGCVPTADLTIVPQSWGDWTAERSRCDNRSNRIRARLGSNRLLQIECLDPNTNTSKSRLTVSNCSYGPATCIQGFVWREARGGDTVCVLPSTRQQTQNDNALAASRRSPNGGAYGSDTCRQGYVWREAFSGDTVCVPPATRQQTAFDNRRSAFRLACR